MTPKANPERPCKSPCSGTMILIVSREEEELLLVLVDSKVLEEEDFWNHKKAPE